MSDEALSKETVLAKIKEMGGTNCFICKHNLSDEELEAADYSLFSVGKLQNQPRLVYTCRNCGNRVPMIVPKGLFK